MYKICIFWNRIRIKTLQIISTLHISEEILCLPSIILLTE